MEKSHVGMSAKICPVTGKQWEDGAILLDTRLKKSLDRINLTGYEICPEVKKQLDKGFLALVVIDASKSDFLANDNLKPEGAYKTGEIIYVRRAVANGIFSIDTSKHDFTYISENAAIKIKKMMPEEK